jgi:GTPase SAR1 family protein
MGSFNLQYLAIRRYEGLKKGLNLEQIISGLSFADAISNLDCFDTRVVERYARERSKYYKEEFKKISNLTVLDSGSLWEHSFNNKSYQAIVCMKIDQYRTSEAKAKLERDPSFFLESFV